MPSSGALALRINPRVAPYGRGRRLVLHQLDPAEVAAARAAIAGDDVLSSETAAGPFCPWTVSGSRPALDDWRRRLRAAHAPLADLLADTLAPAASVFRHAHGTLDLSRPRVMGIVNVTPDSFSDGGHWLDAQAAIEQGLRLVDEGADLLDIGGESTRPGAAPVDTADELARVLPVVEGLAARTDAPLSIDTAKPAVAREALAAGASLVNDITGFAERAMAEVVAAAGAGAVLMHIQGQPRTMQQAPHYDDLLFEVTAHWRRGMARAAAAGLTGDQLLLDPGIGFGKTLAHNLALLRALPELASVGRPLLVGTSRKSFIRDALTAYWGDAPPASGAAQEPAALREAGTAASVGWAVAHGAAVVRVHDVRAARQVVDLTAVLAGALD